MEIFEYSNIGSREKNQDYVTHRIFSDGSALFVLCDGMGGYAYGEVAAKVVAESILEFFSENYKDANPESLFRESMMFANDSLMITRLGMSSKMGAVVVAAYVLHGNIFISWLGDSRAYLFRSQQEIYVTKDHSLMNELKGVRPILASDIQKYTSIVTKCIMGDDKITLDIPVDVLNYRSGDILYLCSDGVHKEIPLSVFPSTNEELRQMLDERNSSNVDNYSLIKVDL